MNRWWLWIPALAGTLFLAFGDPLPKPEIVGASPVRAKTPANAGRAVPAPVGAAAEEVVALIPRSLLYPGGSASAPSRDLFARRGWTEAPQPSMAVPETPAPPEFPFSVVGRRHDKDGIEVFLSGENGVVAARVGDVIDGGQYQVKQVTHQRLVLVYVPLNHEHVIDLGEM